MKVVDKLTTKVQHALHTPADQLHRWQLALRYAVGTFRVGRQQLRADRAGQMAAALTYRTIFSLVPMFVIGLLAFNAFGGFGSLQEDLKSKLYDYLGLSIAIQSQASDTSSQSQANLPPRATVRDDPSTPLNEQTAAAAAHEERLAGGQNPESPAPAAEQKETRQRVDQLLDDLTQRVSQVSISSIGVVGIALLIWAALALVIALEDSFNRIFQAPQGRPWHLRISIYWAVVTLGPVLVALSFLLSNQLIAAADSVLPLNWLITLLTPFASLAATWLLLLLMYLLLPNAKVQLKPALMGSGVAAVLWELSKWGFRLYVSQAVGYSALYGSLGLVPLFLLWLNLTWLVILFGLEITYVGQTVDRKALLTQDAEPDEPDHSAFDPTWVIPAATLLADAFRQGESRSIDELADALGIPRVQADRLATELCEAGIVHQVDLTNPIEVRFSLSRPAESVALRDLLNITQSHSHAPLNTHADHRPAEPTRQFLQTLRDAQSDVAAARTLADLLPPAGGSTAAHTS